MKESGVMIGINRTETIGNGVKVQVIPQKQERNPVGHTSVHEAQHSVAAIAGGKAEVVSATIIPGPGYLGLTQLSRFDAIAAAAPHGMGSGGTSHDMRIVRYMGLNPHSVARAARSVIEAHGPEVQAVAEKLEEKGTLTGFEIKEAFREARKPKEATIVFEMPDGTRKTIEKQKVQEGGFVIFERRLVEQENKAIKAQSQVALAA